MKKNNEEIKERLLKAHALSDDELEQVSGGGDEILEYGCYCGTCPVCRCPLVCVYNVTLNLYMDIFCERCGHTEPDRYR